jgi:hypothetical protein
MNWGPGAAGGFQNALSTGLQLGQMVRQQEQQNALMQQRQAQIDLENRRQTQIEDKATRDGQIATLGAKFLEGDEAAGQELARLSIDDWVKVDNVTRQRATDEAQVLGNAALQLIPMDATQRAGQYTALLQEFPQYKDKIEALMFAPLEAQNYQLQAIAARAKLTNTLQGMLEPKYQVLPQGADLVNTRDPQAVAQFAPGGAQGGTSQRTVVRTGRDASGRRVVQYSDGTIEYAAN